MSRLKWSKNRDKYVKDIIDVAWLGIENERGYMNFQKKSVIVLKVLNNIDSEYAHSIVEEFWCYSNWTKKDVKNRIKEFIKKHENVTVEDLANVEAIETTFD